LKDCKKKVREKSELAAKGIPNDCQVEHSPESFKNDSSERLKFLVVLNITRF
jgi:hypothetical protein